MTFPDQRKLFFSLNSLLRQLLKHEIELPRVSRTACLLALGGASLNSLPSALMDMVLSAQNKDGGWVGPDDTMWNLLYLKMSGFTDSESYRAGIEFLRNNVQESIGWGRSLRDIPRIPVTGRILYFLKEMNTRETMENLLSLWAKERNSLTYKAASVLLACSTYGLGAGERIVNETWRWLRSQQNTDGGFGPWKGHPAGSDVYSTSMALLGLVKFGCNDLVVERAVSWMAAEQLDIGLWGYHQIEDGASWAWYALNEIMRNR